MDAVNCRVGNLDLVAVEGTVNLGIFIKGGGGVPT